MTTLLLSRGFRRIGVLINYAALSFILLFGVFSGSSGWTDAFRLAFWVAVLAVLITFLPLHLRTGLWRLAHARADTLDERELQQNLNSLRYAYLGFSIASLLVLLTLILLEGAGQIQMLIVFWALLYLAHTLPSAVLAWRLTRVPAQAEE
jgi:hypothetical protein